MGDGVLMKKGLVMCIMFVFIVLGTMQNVQAANFKDMNQHTPLYIEASYLADRGIISGYPDGTFKPNALISKKHIAVMLVNALDLPTTALENPNYQDIPQTHPYYKEIAAAYSAGLFPKAEYFKPDAGISRAFMARLMAKAFDLEVLEGTEGVMEFSDVPRGSEFYSDIMKVTSNNIAKGYDNGTFKPDLLLTRAQFSAFLTRTLTLNTMNIMPDPNYVYYYTDGTSTYRYDYDQVEENGLAYWFITNETMHESIPRLGFRQDMNFYGEGYDDWYHYDRIIPFPFVVTQIHRDSDIGPVSYGDSWIIDTDMVRTVHGVEYRDVLAIKSYLPWENRTVYEYYAKDIGLIQATDSKGNEEYGLMYREVREGY
ncbi:S-layer homology domain-containing protein [Lysinibacillus antri]|uniref:S-layer homology domain-containing protein n=2 Tax=Lysinibacillus antri TaxID=2498145 RepID=A0A432LBY3_9BACI|nr:S-layer homology domain-containing protein [Lysinibacillus antri]